MTDPPERPTPPADGPADRKPKRRPGPPLFRQYVQPQESLRERLVRAGIGAAVAVTFLLVLVAVLWAFVRAPLVTLVVLGGVWGVGIVILLVKRARERTRRELERELQRLGKWGRH